MDRFYADGLDGVHFSSLIAYKFQDVDFLKEHPSISAVSVSCGKGIDLAGLAALKGLKYLTLEDYRSPPDLRQFSQLEEFSGEWSKDLKIDSDCCSLKKLTLFKYKCATSDCKAIPVVESLEELNLIQSSIRSLDGIETQQHVERMHLCRLPKLVSIDAIALLRDSALRRLTFERCKKIAGMEVLGALSKVKKITIDLCSELPPLSFLKGCQSLEEFVFMDTALPDGDLSPILELPSLRYFGTFDKSHFSHKESEINALLSKDASQ